MLSRDLSTSLIESLESRIAPASLSVADVSIVEGAAGETKTLTFTVTASEAGLPAFDVPYTFGRDDAEANDFVGTNGTLHFDAGQTTATITVTINGDDAYEQDETFGVYLGEVTTGGVQIDTQDAYATATILNDDIQKTHTVDAKHPLTYIDEDGDQMVIKLKGAGTATVKFLSDDGTGDLESISLTGSKLSSALSITMTKQAPGTGRSSLADLTSDSPLGSFTAKKVDVNGNVAFNDVIKSISLGDFNGDMQIDNGTSRTPTSITGNFLNGNITAATTISSIKAAGLSGFITAEKNIGSITVKGFDFDATIDATGTDKVPAIRSITVIGSDFSGDVYAHGRIGSITVKATKEARDSGNFMVGFLQASAIGSVSIAGFISDSSILAGTDLGADHAYGGVDEDADVFQSGSIGLVKIGGDSLNSKIAAGLNPGDTDSYADDSIEGGTASVIKKFTIGGTLDDADGDNYFAAGKFTAKPRINGESVTPDFDIHFLVG